LSYNHIKNHRENRKQLLCDLLGGKCAKCGYNKCISALDFHHIDPTKKDFIIAAKIYALNKVLPEVKKCILLCCRCHRELHSNLWKLSDIEIPLFQTHILDQYLTRYEKEIDCEQCGQTITINKSNTKRFCSERCRRLSSRKVDRPTKTTLLKEISTHTWVELGSRYGVSDNAVKKWAKSYGII